MTYNVQYHLGARPLLKHPVKFKYFFQACYVSNSKNFPRFYLPAGLLIEGLYWNNQWKNFQVPRPTHTSKHEEKWMLHKQRPSDITEVISFNDLMHTRSGVQSTQAIII